MGIAVHREKVLGDDVVGEKIDDVAERRPAHLGGRL